MKIFLLALALITGVSLSEPVTMTGSTVEGAELHFSFPLPEYSEVDLHGTTFSRITVEGCDNLDIFSMPRIPVYRVWLEIPSGATVEYSIFCTDRSILDGPPWQPEPGVLSASKDLSPDAFALSLSEDIYRDGAAFPQEPVRIIYPGEMRGRNLALVEIAPALWSPADNTIEFLTEGNIQLSFTGGCLESSFSRAGRFQAEPFESILSELLLNYGLFEPGTRNFPGPYLIISHSDFTGSELDAFAAWKESIGFDVTIVDLSETGSTYQEIQAYILDALENWPDPPVYVLLVGDTMYLPANSANSYSGATDLYYVCLDDGGFIPDAMIGRFSVRTSEQIEVMTGRAVDYEQNVTGFTPWVQNTCWIASMDNWNITEGTHNYCINTWAEPMGYTSDKVYPRLGGTASDAITSINGGISMLTFSGHGYTTSWDDMQFTQSHFNQLTNDGMFPGVISHACLTGSYGSGASSAWCETWTRTPDKGGLWFWGCVPSSYWNEDDIQQRGEYEWFLGEGLHKVMGFLNAGKLELYEHYSGGGRCRYYFEGYNLMGDPSLEMAVWGILGMGEGEEEGSVPGSIMILGNPVGSSAVISLDGSGPCELDVYDLAGRQVGTVWRGTLDGELSLVWDTDGLATGIYMLNLRLGDSVETRRVTVIR